MFHPGPLFKDLAKECHGNDGIPGASILGCFTSRPATQIMIPPPSQSVNFDANVALDAAKRKRESWTHEISPPATPHILCDPISLRDLLICDQCGKQLSEKSALIRHMQIHDKTTKKFVCGVCGNKQSQRSNWKQHMMIHIGETIPPEIYASLDEESKALVDGDERFVSRDIYEKRVAIAQKRRMRFKNL
ncbi:hypothetical protein TCAL_14509 [Tigriopus californicus]|uniref:C2H2-type domain-containing protein n=1 Tax=Tigriopus californicus TaxID=6832 RepID=A0A553PRN7_TIGCA|nr:hypothetical protein TCAL_14509 [Tigriopus californicus]